MLIPAAQLYRNLPQIRLTNGPVLKNIAVATAKNHPDRGILLADDGNLLFLTKAQIADAGRNDSYVAVNSYILKFPAYQSFVARSNPGKWQAITNVNEEKKVDDGLLVQRMLAESKSNSIAYLHPSFGYYYEAFNAVPHGLSYHLSPHTEDYFIPPPPGSNTIAMNEEFWCMVRRELLPPILAQTIPPDPNRKRNIPDQFFDLIKLRAKGQCVACHTIPGIAGATGTIGPKLVEGTNAPLRIKDKDYKGKAKSVPDYIMESIVEPSAYVVKGFPDNTMPKVFGKA